MNKFTNPRRTGVGVNSTLSPTFNFKPCPSPTSLVIPLNNKEINDENWRDSTNLSSKMLYMYKKEMNTDVTLSVINNENLNKVFKVHEIVLIGSSEVFDKMLTGDFKEKSTKFIEIKEQIDHQIFELFITFLYTYDIIINSWDESVKLYRLAHKYMILPLKQACLKYINNNRHLAKACSGLEFAQLYMIEDLEKHFLTAIKKETLNIITHENFLSANINTVITILSQDELSIDREITLFNAIAKWIKNKTENNDNDETNDILSQILPKIRFLSMTPQEFAQGPIISGLLKQDEWAPILANIALENSVPYPVGFTILRRNYTLSITLNSHANLGTFGFGGQQAKPFFGQSM